jgi:hypothetical protein
MVRTGGKRLGQPGRGARDGERGGVTVTESPSDFARRAMQDIQGVLERRARLYRRLVMGVCLIGLCALPVAIGLGARYSCFAVPAAFAMVGIHLTLDGIAVKQWAEAVVREWREGGLDVRVLQRVIITHPALPKETIAGMFASLPCEVLTGTAAARNRLLEPGIESQWHSSQRRIAIATGAGVALTFAASWLLSFGHTS